jgi:glycosyltransferase involved in cell wall biosynthesis
VISGDLWAGAAVQVYQTVSDLRRRNVEVSVAVFNDGVLARRLDAEGIAWRLFDEKRLTGVGMARGLARFIGETDPECLHVHAYKEHILTTVARSLAGRRDIPIVRTFHGRRQIPAGLPAVARLAARAVEQIERWLLRRSVLIAVSRDLEKHLQNAYPDARVALVRNGIRLPDAPKSREEVRARWRVPEGAFWVGCVARLEPVKNLPCLVRAAAALATALPGLRVSIFGTGSQDGALRELIRALGAERIVTLEGFDDDMAGTMAAFDCFTLCSLHEGLPMSLLEAMALGVPVVCSRVGGMRELVTPGRTGLLFESDNDAELAACLRTIHESRDAALKMGLAARQLVSESYTIEATNAALLNVYESVIPGRRKPEQRASGAVRR